jgi:hypothetical protein
MPAHEPTTDPATEAAPLDAAECTWDPWLRLLALQTMAELGQRVLD